MSNENKPTEKFFSGSHSYELAENIAQHYGNAMGQMNKIVFSDGEFSVSFEETVRGSRVFFICSTQPPLDNLMELLLMIDAAKRASAKHITAVIPYFGWARQDRKDKPRVPIAAKLVASLIETAGATRVITMDLHSDQIQGFFQIPVDNLYASSIFVPFIEKMNLPNLAIASPDMGGSKRAYAYAKYLKSDVIICYKQRSKANEIDSMTAIGDVEGKNIILLDDMTDTAGTLTKAADMMMEKGALSVIAMVSHPVLSGDAYEKIEDSKIEKLYVTDSIALKKETPKIKVLSCASMFAEVMKKVHKNQSISNNFVIK